MSSATALVESSSSTFVPLSERTWHDMWPTEPLPTRTHSIEITATKERGEAPRTEEGEAVEPQEGTGLHQWAATLFLQPGTEPSRKLASPTSLTPDISQEARSYLTGDLRFIYQHIQSLAVNCASWMQLPIKSVRLSVKRSWEEKFTELLLQVFVEGNIPQSLALWDSIGDAIKRWAEKQTPKVRRLLNEQFAIFVEPSLP